MMFTLRSSVMGALVGLTGLASLAVTPAQAALILKINGTQVNSSGNNDGVSFDCVGTTNCGAAGATGWTRVNFGILGNLLAPPGELFDGSNVDADAATGAIKLTLTLAETDLTAKGVESFFGNFTGTVTGSLDVTRDFYIDPNNGTDATGLDAIGEITTNCSGGTCDSASKFSKFNLDTGSTLYSIIEVITLTPADGKIGSTSTDDTLLVPEPAALSIFGLGLLVLGAMGWRRRSSDNLAA